MSFPALLGREQIHQRLQIIFPEGTPERDKCIRKATADTIFAALYIGAIQGSGRWLAPVHVYRMSDERLKVTDEESRLTYYKKHQMVGSSNWYADTSKEQIRDESLRFGLVPNNAVVENQGVPTTSSKGRYALEATFANLFDPELDETAFQLAALAWQEAHLSPAALARVSLVRSGATEGTEKVLVKFPGGETRQMAAGPSSPISKAVIEVFASRFLIKPAVLWLSESGNKEVARDVKLAAKLNLKIDASKNLPDIILVDLGNTAQEFLLVFVEVVASDGPMTTQRVEAFSKMAAAGGYKDKQLAFVTAYLDRSRGEFKKTIPSLPWRSFAWFVSEPQHVIMLHDGEQAHAKLGALVRL